MVRILLLVGGLVLAAVVTLSVFTRTPDGLGYFSYFQKLPKIDSTFQRGFRSDSLLKINALRHPHSVEMVSVDEEIQSFISNYLSSHPNPAELDLEDVFDTLQNKFPGAQYLAANLVTGSNRKELVDVMNQWDAVGNPDFNSLTTGVFVSGRKLGALGVMARRIPKFSLEAANTVGGRFFNQCPHCQRVHALALDKKSRTLILTCPDCEKPFDVLAADTHGYIRRATDFMKGFSIPENDLIREAQSGEEKVLTLWQQVADRCRYELDQNSNDAREAWKTPEETWNEKAGDCEDTAILLADALISEGFPARVAIGWNGNIGQHAWCVVMIGERQYVLESTLQGRLDHKALVSIEDAAPFYQPEQLFDRDHLYFSGGEPGTAGTDYFADSIWRPLAISKPVASVEADTVAVE